MPERRRTARSAGGTRMRPAASSSTSSAWPTSRRCRPRIALVERRQRHQARLDRLPGGARVDEQAAGRVGGDDERRRRRRAPASASRCRAGIASRPFASSARCVTPRKNVVPPAGKAPPSTTACSSCRMGGERSFTRRDRPRSPDPPAGSESPTSPHFSPLGGTIGEEIPSVNRFPVYEQRLSTSVAYKCDIAIKHGLSECFESDVAEGGTAAGLRRTIVRPIRRTTCRGAAFHEPPRAVEAPCRRRKRAEMARRGHSPDFDPVGWALHAGGMAGRPPAAGGGTPSVQGRDGRGPEAAGL